MQPLRNYHPPKIPLKILHRDADLIVVNKDSGLLSVPGKDPAHGDCVEARVKSAYPEALLVHRLDMDTSGVMVFAANPAAQRHIGMQFQRRHLEKTYEALVWGSPEQDHGVIELPLIVDWPNRPLQKVCFETGKASETRFEVLERLDGTARVALFPKTGRSHQLRVHMNEQGHPILGDRFYASGKVLEAADRLCLHSKSLTLRHPTGGEETTFRAEVPF